MRIPASRLFGAVFGVAAATCQPSAAQMLPAAETVALDRLCRDTARGPLSPTAVAVAATAQAEHQSFGGHVIDRDGRLLRFGAVEADARRDEAAGRRVPWRQVMRYWETIGGNGGGALGLRRHPGIADRADVAGGGDLVPLAQVLERLRAADMPDAEREALMQAASRAAAVDVPWSAAFVSHVVLTAGVSRLAFAPSMAHLDYVSEAARRSRVEAGGGAASSFYRACDPHRTPMRPGDLLCLHRHPPEDLPGAGSRTNLFGALVAALSRGERPVWNLHCDIVVARDESHRTASVIGGNVLQSVARRDIAIDRRGALARPRRGPACFDNRAPGTLCRPEGAPWFVLLQAAGDP